ncbi:MAG TPA: histidine phosphatase family protein [Actinomycetota bacterium]|nr:histidine phosphatase family protein [Actinomycetota bacterium]
MRTLELRRHARRDPSADRLSDAGRAQAAEVGRTMEGGYDVVFVSPAQRTAETVAWFLRALHHQLPPHEVVPGLAGRGTDGSAAALGRVVGELLTKVPEGGRGLAVGHTPLIEQAIRGLTARAIEPLAECEGVLLTDAEGRIAVRELRVPRPG